jgi:ribosomal protein S18 acetylase RimI-like enzyme
VRWIYQSPLDLSKDFMEARLATHVDLLELTRLFDLYRQFYQQPSNLSEAKAFLEARLTNQESVIFVVPDKEKLLGFVQLYPSFSSVSMKKLWILNDLFVARESRKSGVGEILMKAAMEYSLKSGAKGLNLMTAKDNVVAQKLYEKLNWKSESLFLTYHFRHYYCGLFFKQE